MTSEKKPDPSLPRVVKGDQNFTFDRAAFRERFYQKSQDRMYDDVATELEKVFEVTWQNYMGYRKSPRTQKAGPEFHEPDSLLPMEWLETRRAIHEAQRRQSDPTSPSRVLVINGSARSDQTCPGEVSKTYRLTKIAREAVAAVPGFEVDFLDLSRLTGEAGLTIYPCKAGVPTPRPLCHWPCTGDPNHPLRQSRALIARTFPRWVRAQGGMDFRPGNWYPG